MNMIKKNKHLLLSVGIFIIVFIIWYFCVITSTDAIQNAYYFVALLSLISVVFLAYNKIIHFGKKTIVSSLVLCLFFSLTVILPMYNAFVPISIINILRIIVAFVSSFLIFCPLFFAAFSLLDNYQIRFRFSKPLNSKILFLSCFACFFLLYFVFLYVSAYPGILTPDSIDQLNQSMCGQYTNHHPFWHTIIISGIIHIGLNLFHDINVAVFLFSVCQIIFVSGCFSFVIVTIYQACESKIIVIFTLLFWLISPYNIAYSVTMWKDVPFGMATMLFVAFLYRIIFSIGKPKLNYFGFIISAFFFGSWRTNGLIALIITTIVLVIILYRKRSLKLLVSVISITLVTVLMNTLFFSIIGVNTARFSESLSIPLQQVSRVIYDGGQLEDDEIAMIDKLLDYDSIPEKYTDYISDPIKFSITQESDNFLKEHKMEYLTLWMRIGIRYPNEYLKAWIDQTKGYWSGGYDFPRWSKGVVENDMGITQSAKSSLVQSLVHKYSKLWKISFLNVFLCIGLFTLAFVFSFVYFVSRKKIHFVFVVPVLSVILTLLIATPVFAEFRYAYSLFTCFPFLLMLLLTCNKKEKSV